MEEKEKVRSEIDEKYKWDLTPIYKSDDDWYKDFEKARKEVKKVTDYKDTFLNSAKDFYDFLMYDQNLDRLLIRLYFYTHLNYDADTTNDNYKKMRQQICDLIDESNVLS